MPQILVSTQDDELVLDTASNCGITSSKSALSSTDLPSCVSPFNVDDGMSWDSSFPSEVDVGGDRRKAAPKSFSSPEDFPFLFDSSFAQGQQSIVTRPKAKLLLDTRRSRKKRRSHERQRHCLEGEETANDSVANVKDKATIFHEKEHPEENLGWSPSTRNVSNGIFDYPYIDTCVDEFVPSDTQGALPGFRCFGLGRKLKMHFLALLFCSTRFSRNHTAATELSSPNATLTTEELQRKRSAI